MYEVNRDLEMWRASPTRLLNLEQRSPKIPSQSFGSELFSQRLSSQRSQFPPLRLIEQQLANYAGRRDTSAHARRV